MDARTIHLFRGTEKQPSAFEQAMRYLARHAPLWEDGSPALVDEHVEVGAPIIYPRDVYRAVNVLWTVADHLPFVVDPTGLPRARRRATTVVRYRGGRRGPTRARLLAEACRWADERLRRLDDFTEVERVRLLAAWSLTTQHAEEFDA